MTKPLEPLTSLSPEKSRLLSLLLRDKGVQPSRTGQSNPIRRRSHSESVPLSFSQEGLWFLDQLDPGGANYNLPGIARLTGHLNVDVLEQSLNEILGRHESLRTTFSMKGDGKPYPVITSVQRLNLPVIDLEALPEAEREAEALRLVTVEAQKPFDLAQGPLFRAVLLQLGKNDYVLVLNLHHIIADGWSMGVLTAELTALYEAFSAGGSSPLPELPIQYSDFALWQREQMRGALLEAQLSYWKQQLGADPLELPTDRARPRVQSYRGMHHPVHLSESLTGALRMLAQREGVTLFNVLLAGFKILLYRYSGQEDIVVGSSFANRNRRELEGLIGFFVNTMPLRTNLSGDPGFRDLLRRVREVTLGAYAHQELPFAKLVQESQPDREPGRHPLFQVVFDLLTPDHNPAVFGYGLSSPVTEGLELPGLTMAPLDVEGGIARFDLAIFIWDLPTGLKGAFEYRTDLFEPETIARMTQYFETLLHHIVAEPDVGLETLVERINDMDQQQQITRQKADKDSARQKLMSSRRKSITEVIPSPPGRRSG